MAFDSWLILFTNMHFALLIDTNELYSTNTYVHVLNYSKYKTKIL